MARCAVRTVRSRPGATEGEREQQSLHATTPHGRLFWPRTASSQAILAAAGLPRQRFHDLRHACATLLREAGEDLDVVSRILGHATITTTANVYGHLTPAMQERSAARMDAILGG